MPRSSTLPSASACCACRIVTSGFTAGTAVSGSPVIGHDVSRIRAPGTRARSVAATGRMRPHGSPLAPAWYATVISAWLCSCSSSACGQPFSTASRSRCSEPTPGLPPHENVRRLAHAHADHLVVDEIGRHADEVQILAALPDDLVTRRERNQVREPFERNALAVAHVALDRIRKTHQRHRAYSTTVCDCSRRYCGR